MWAVVWDGSERGWAVAWDASERGWAVVWDGSERGWAVMRDALERAGMTGRGVMRRHVANDAAGGGEGGVLLPLVGRVPYLGNCLCRLACRVGCAGERAGGLASCPQTYARDMRFRELF